MTGRMAVDFGTSKTVVALWDDIRKEAAPQAIPDYSLLIQQGAEQVSLIPSLIHYTDDHRRWIGAQVVNQNLTQSPHTFRWMKRYISHRSPIRLRISGKEITPFDAGRDFLSSILILAAQTFQIGDEEIALTVPVEAYEHYEDWLANTASTAGLGRYRIIDEPSAAALGYGTHIQPGHIYLIFDFGGGTLHATVVLMEESDSSATGRRCRVLGKAGREIGGSSIDQWLFQDALRQNQRSDMDEEIRRLSNSLLMECEEAKKRLSYGDRAELSIMNPDTGAILAAEWTRTSFEDLLDRNDLFAGVNQVVRSALNAARERGYKEDDIKAALMVGGSSLIPSVQRTLRQFFGKERLFADHPFDAIARGGAAFIAGVDFYDHIQHDYAIRYTNPQKGGYDYHTLVERGTAYPTTEPIEVLNIKASYPNQTQLGLAIFEMGEQRSASENSRPVELVFDPSGAARIMPISPAEQERRSLFWMNEKSPTFLTADPPGVQGEDRFRVEFNIDANKRLLITVRDLKTGQLTHKDYPVVKLT
ncbi:MAG TPA: Hsp70 family protein [Anaerolineaceae bacterium]|nr:Hsp70 family protein [Anaerolineaceae bacterium]HPN50892.1 Hsp70 family protein [Anaerolineaceae bacterium]